MPVNVSELNESTSSITNQEKSVDQKSIKLDDSDSLSNKNNKINETKSTDNQPKDFGEDSLENSSVDEVDDEDVYAKNVNEASNDEEDSSDDIENEEESSDSDENSSESNDSNSSIEDINIKDGNDDSEDDDSDDQTDDEKCNKESKKRKLSQNQNENNHPTKFAKLENNDNGIWAFDIKSKIDPFTAKESTVDFSNNVVTDDLCSGTLDYYRATNGNVNYYCKLNVSFIRFHTTKKLLIVGGAEGSIMFFKVNGETNERVGQGIFYERFPIKKGELLDENKLLVISKFNSVNLLNLHKMSTTKHKISDDGSRLHCVSVSPNKQYILFGCNRMNVYIVDPKTMNVISKLPVEGRPVSISFSHNGKYFYVATTIGAVHIYEVDEDKNPIYKKKFFEESHQTSSVAISPDDKYIAFGSLNGGVLLYSMVDIWKFKKPKPCNHFFQLEARINKLRFSNDGELLAFGSDLFEKSIRIVHIKSMTVFKNFHGQSLKDQRITSIDFSKNNRYLSLGLTNGVVAQFVLKDYPLY